MNNMKHILGGFVIFSALVSLILNVYVGVIDNYALSDSYVKEEKTLFEAFLDLNLIESINDFSNSLQEITSPGSTFDLLGALLSAGIGIIKIMMGVIIFPVQIFNIITSYYSIPPIISTSIIILFSLYIGFILLRYYTRTE